MTATSVIVASLVSMDTRIVTGNPERPVQFGYAVGTPTCSALRAPAARPEGRAYEVAARELGPTS